MISEGAIKAMMESLEEEKERLWKVIEVQQKVRQIVKKWDGKKINKRISEDIEKQEKLQCYIGRGRRATTSWEITIRGVGNRSAGYNYSNVFWCCNTEYLKDEKGRLDYSKFNNMILASIQQNRKKLAEVNSDLIFGKETLKEVEIAGEYYRDLVRGLSSHLRSEFFNNFKIDNFI